MLYVTGITGYTGSCFLERLIAEKFDDKIRCVVRPKSNTTLLDASKLYIERVVGDLNDKDFLRNTLKGINTVLHIANIHYSDNVISAAIENDVEWVICVHTTGIYSKYRSASGEYKRIEEIVLQKRKNINITILRPTMIYGSSRDKNIYRLISYLYSHKFFPIFGSGNNFIQPVHGRDLGNAYYDVIYHKPNTINRCYDLSGEKPIRYLDMVKMIIRELGSSNIIVHIPMALSIAAVRIYNYIDKNAIITEEQVLRMLEDRAYPHEEAKQDFGFSPRSLYEGIREEIDEFLQYKTSKK